MKDFILKSLEKTMNLYLAMDKESNRRLSALNGKVISMDFLVIPFKFQLKIANQKIQVQDIIEDHDVLIKGTPFSLLHMSLFKAERKRSFAEDVTIEGNLELGQQIIDLFDEMEIDWEEHFSYVVGDVSAHHIGNIARKFKDAMQRTREVFSQNINEYVHEEASLFPPREELQDFFNDIDILRMDADRVEMRVKRLKEGLL